MDSKGSGDNESCHLEGVLDSEGTEHKEVSNHGGILDSDGAADQLNVPERDLSAGVASSASTINNPLPIDGICNDVDLFDAVTCMLGYPVKIYTQSGDIYKGVISTFSPQFEFALELSRNNDSNNSIKKAIFHSNDIVNVEIVDADVDFEIGTFKMDSTIGKSQEQNGEDRVLQWDCSESAANNSDEDNLEEATSEGWDAQKMLNVNEDEFGVASGYDRKLSAYAKPFKNKDAKDYKVGQAIAFQHEKSACGTNESDQVREHDVEEEMYAAATRALKSGDFNKNSAYSQMKRSGQPPKIVITAPTPMSQPAEQQSSETSLTENQPRRFQQNLQVEKKQQRCCSVKKQRPQQQYMQNEQGPEKRQQRSSQRPHFRVDLPSKPRKSSPDPWIDNAYQQAPSRGRFYNHPPQMQRRAHEIFQSRSSYTSSFRAGSTYGVPPHYAQSNVSANNEESFETNPNDFHTSRNPRMAGSAQQSQVNSQRSTPVYRTGYLTPFSESAYIHNYCWPTSRRITRENVFAATGQPLYAYGPIGRACTPMNRICNMHPFSSTDHHHHHLHVPEGYLPFNYQTVGNAGTQWNMMGNRNGFIGSTQNGPPRHSFYSSNTQPSTNRPDIESDQ